MKLDQIDKKMLRHLQDNARITNAELADKVGLSPTPCLRRLRRLENDGIIKGYHAELNREMLGVNVNALILVKLVREEEKIMHEFEESILQRPEVVECSLVTGKFDYFLRVIVATLPAYEAFLSEGVLRMPNVLNVESSFILKEVENRKVLQLAD